MSHSTPTRCALALRSLCPVLASLGFVAACCAPLAAEPHGSTDVQQASFERAAPQSVRFAYRSSQVGDQVEQTIRTKLRLNTMVRQGTEIVEQGITHMLNQQRRVVQSTEIADGRTTAVALSYKSATKQFASLSSDTEPLPPPVRQPVDSKRYLCRREGDLLVITDPEGNTPPPEEHKIVAENMDMIGRGNPLAEFLAGRTIKIGQRIAVPNEIATKLLGIGGAMEEVTQFDLTLSEITVENDRRLAVFEASLEAASSDSSQMRVQFDGPLTIEPDTCRVVSANLIGPIGISETRGSLGQTFQISGTGRMTVSIESTHRDAGQ